MRIRPDPRIIIGTFHRINLKEIALEPCHLIDRVYPIYHDRARSHRHGLNVMQQY